MGEGREGRGERCVCVSVSVCVWGGGGVHRGEKEDSGKYRIFM